MYYLYQADIHQPNSDALATLIILVGVVYIVYKLIKYISGK